MRKTERLPRAAAVAVVLGVLAAGTASAQAGIGFDPTSCTSLSSAPVHTAIDYGAAIQAIFVNFDGNVGCKDCHTSNGGTGTPTGNLNLDPTEVSPWLNIVNVPSDEPTGLNYVTPGKPELSYLFRKINCDTPDVMFRMPSGMPPLTVDQQATIYDWIAAGAPVGTTDQIFRGTFDLRGFVP